MNAWVAVTDGDWFRFLAELDQKEGVDEVNFWQPKRWGGTFRVLQRGEPLLFKLKTPHNAIAGGGFFAHYTKMPMSLAWSAFGPLNGAATQDEVRKRIARLRRVDAPWWEDFTIGCILLSEPFFWPRELWIPQPDDFSRNIVRGKSYDLTQGTGWALWDQVLQRLEASWARTQEAEEQPELPLELPGGYTEGAPARRRIGQGIFRIVVTDAYGRRCAVTNEKALPALDAAHIRPFSEVVTHDVRNGLLLRSDVHRLFDSGYLTVTPGSGWKPAAASETTSTTARPISSSTGAGFAPPNRPTCGRIRRRCGGTMRTGFGGEGPDARASSHSSQRVPRTFREVRSEPRGTGDLEGGYWFRFALPCAA